MALGQPWHTPTVYQHMVRLCFWLTPSPVRCGKEPKASSVGLEQVVEASLWAAWACPPCPQGCGRGEGPTLRLPPCCVTLRESLLSELCPSCHGEEQGDVCSAVEEPGSSVLLCEACRQQRWHLLSHCYTSGGRVSGHTGQTTAQSCPLSCQAAAFLALL